MTSDKGKLVQNYISKNPNVPSRTLGRKIYSENPLLFSSEKAAYGAILCNRNRVKPVVLPHPSSGAALLEAAPLAEVGGCFWM